MLERILSTPLNFQIQLILKFVSLLFDLLLEKMTKLQIAHLMCTDTFCNKHNISQ